MRAEHEDRHISRWVRVVVAAIAGAALTLALGSGAHAQAVPVAPLISPPIPRALPQAQPEVLLPRAPPIAPAEPIPAGPPVRIDAVHIEGATVYPPATLQPLYAGLVGPAVPRERLVQFVEALQTRYRKDGYILTVVRGSAERSGGRTVFVVRVTEGYISDIKLAGDIGPVSKLAYRILEHLTALRPLNNRALERYLLLVNDLPGVTIHAVLRPVAPPEPGAVELVAELSRKKFGAMFQFDNRGAPEVGPYEALLSGTANSFTRFGEQNEAIFYNTFNREEVFGQFDTSAYLNSEGLRIRGYFGRGNTQPGGALTGTGFDSDLTIAGVGLSYPVIRSRRLNLSVDGGFDTYDAPIEITGADGLPMLESESHLRILRLGGSLDFQDTALFGLPAGNLLIAKVSHGLSGFGASSNSEVLSARPGNDIDFAKVTGQLTRVQNLFTWGSVGTALKTSIGGQFTNDVLPPSEQYFLGGTQFGRGFFNGEIAGDRALGASAEFQVNKGFQGIPLVAPDHKLDVQFYSFFDYGRSYNLAPADIDHTIDSFGIGARSNLTNSVFVELEGVRRLTTHPDGAGPDVSPLNDYAIFSRVVFQY